MNEISRRIGKYTLQYQLGHGSAGEVWKGLDTAVDEEIVLKLYHPDLLQADPYFLDHLLQQNQILTGLQHPNIVCIREINLERPSNGGITAYMAMNYVEGQSLEDYIRVTSRQGQYPPISEIVYLLICLASAIDYAHRQGVIHGNVKPGNILLDQRNTSQTENGEPMLTDFGIANLLGYQQMRGKPYYLSPEQAEGELATPASDIYAIGVILYEIFTGRRPFHGEGATVILKQHITQLPTPPLKINPTLPHSLSEVILRALAKKPAERYPTASQLMEGVAEACSSTTAIQLLTREPSVYDRSGSEEPLHQPVQEEVQSEEIQPELPETEPDFRTETILGVTVRVPIAQDRARRERLSEELSGPLPAVNNGDLLKQMPGASLRLPSIRLQTDPHAHKLNIRSLPGMRNQAAPPTGNIESAKTNMMPPIQPQSGAMNSPRNRSATPTSLPFMGMDAPIVPESPKPTPQIQMSSAGIVPDNMIAPVLPRTITQKKLNKRLLAIPIGLLILLLLILLFRALSGSTTTNNNNTMVSPPSNAVGQVFLQDDALGRSSAARLELANIPEPPTGKTYYGWLKTEGQPAISLGKLTVSNGKISTVYPGNDKHTNLLAYIESLSITEEDSQATPKQPTGKEVYRGSLNEKALPDLKKMLYQNPDSPDKRGTAVNTLDTISSLTEKAGTISDYLQNNKDVNLAIRQSVRIVEMLDGTDTARQVGDLPGKYNTDLNLSVGLLTVNGKTGYIDMLSNELDGVEKNAGNDFDTKKHIQNVRNAITDLRDWLQKMRTYTVEMLKSKSFKEPVVATNALQVKKLAQDAYAGRIVPPNTTAQNNSGSAGALQAYNEGQLLTVIIVKPV